MHCCSWPALAASAADSAAVVVPQPGLYGAASCHRPSFQPPLGYSNIIFMLTASCSAPSGYSAVTHLGSAFGHCASSLLLPFAPHFRGLRTETATASV